jgi:hypothetical protein
MSVKAMEWVFRHSQSKNTDRAVMLAIAWHMNATTGRCCPSLKTLAADANCDERSTRRSIQRLAALGELEIDSGNGGRGGKGKVNNYALTYTTNTGTVPVFGRARYPDSNTGTGALNTGTGALNTGTLPVEQEERERTKSSSSVREVPGAGVGEDEEDQISKDQKPRSDGKLITDPGSCAESDSVPDYVQTIMDAVDATQDHATQFAEWTIRARKVERPGKWFATLAGNGDLKRRFDDWYSIFVAEPLRREAETRQREERLRAEHLERHTRMRAEVHAFLSCWDDRDRPTCYHCGLPEEDNPLHNQFPHCRRHPWPEGYDSGCGACLAAALGNPDAEAEYDRRNPPRPDPIDNPGVRALWDLYLTAA